MRVLFLSICLAGCITAAQADDATSEFLEQHCGKVLLTIPNWKAKALDQLILNGVGGVAESAHEAGFVSGFISAYAFSRGHSDPEEIGIRLSQTCSNNISFSIERALEEAFN